MQHFIGGEWTDAENAAVFGLQPLDDSLYGQPPREPVRICERHCGCAGRLSAYKASRSNGNAGSFALPS